MRHFISAVFLVGTSTLVGVFLVFPLFHRMEIIGSEQVALVSQMGATIAENPTNKLALEFKNRALELDAREKRLSDAEASLREEQIRVEHRVRNVLAGSIGLSLLTLFVMNHLLRKRIHSAEIADDLHHHHKRLLALNDGLRVRIESGQH